MCALSASVLLEVWERGLRQNPVGRGLELLALAAPDIPRPELVSIGRRDGMLLALRERIFGTDVNAITACEGCGESIELSFRISDIRVDQLAEDQAVWEYGGCSLRLRAPNSVDVRAALAAPPHAAADALFAQCVTEVRHDRTAVALPETVVDRAAERIAALDPQAEVLLTAVCAQCGLASRVCFDIVSFLWREIAALAERVLREVHALASAYGWDESRILGMSAVRRRCYLDLVDA
jgi:hypothetical protein